MGVGTKVPKEEAPKIRTSQGAQASVGEPSPFQFEEDPMLTLEEPPIKMKKTESFSLEEPLTAEYLTQVAPERENNIMKSPETSGVYLWENQLHLDQTLLFM